MIEIPKQLIECRFCKIPHKSKKPYEKAWTMLEREYERQPDKSWKNKKTGELCKVGKKEKVIYKGELHNYSYDEMSEWLKTHKENYGVLTGVNQLGVLDDDTEDKNLMKIALDKFNNTFQVNEHLYFFLEGWDGKKIIFYDKNGKHVGELQGIGEQVVGANSIHPTGKTYKIIKDIPILELDFKIFKVILEDYQTKKSSPKKVNKDYTLKKIDHNDFIEKLKSYISMEQILREFGVDTSINPTNCPFHICSQECLSFNNETCNCFDTDCGKAYNIFSFVQKIKGIGSAESIKWLSDFAGLTEEYEIQKRKYLNRNKEPMGWANSINIKRMSERYELINCPTCNVAFEFDERLGFYKCPVCKSYGGLKRFAELCLNKSMEGK